MVERAEWLLNINVCFWFEGLQGAEASPHSCINRFSLILQRFLDHLTLACLPYTHTQWKYTYTQPHTHTHTHTYNNNSLCRFPEFAWRWDQLSLVEGGDSKSCLHDGNELLILHVITLLCSSIIATPVSQSVAMTTSPPAYSWSTLPVSRCLCSQRWGVEQVVWKLSAEQRR